MGEGPSLKKVQAVNSLSSKGSEVVFVFILYVYSVKAQDWLMLLPSHTLRISLLISPNFRLSSPKPQGKQKSDQPTIREYKKSIKSALFIFKHKCIVNNSDRIAT